MQSGTAQKYLAPRGTLHLCGDSTFYKYSILNRIDQIFIIISSMSRTERIFIKQKAITNSSPVSDGIEKRNLDFHGRLITLKENSS